MTTQIIPYLLFDNNCKEAMTFYKECLDAELTMNTVAESPVAAQMSADLQDKIIHALLKKGDIVFMASDICGQGEVKNGNTVSLSLNCSSEEEINNYFNKLSTGGNVTTPLRTEFWGATFGQFVDKFGISWMVNFDKPAA